MAKLHAGAAALLVVSICAPPTISAGLTFADAAALRRLQPEELAVERLVAAAQRAATGGRGFTAEGATASVEGGKRESGAEQGTDLALRLEWPLLASRGERRELAESLSAAAAGARAGARATADSALAESFVGAWLSISCAFPFPARLVGGGGGAAPLAPPNAPANSATAVIATQVFIPALKTWALRSSRPARIRPATSSADIGPSC